MRCHRNHLSQYIFIFGILQKSIPAISPSVHGAPIIPPSLFVTVIVRMRLLTVLFHVAVVMTSSPQNCHWLEGTEVLVNMFCCTENHDASFNSLIHKTFFTALKMTADSFFQLNFGRQFVNRPTRWIFLDCIHVLTQQRLILVECDLKIYNSNI